MARPPARAPARKFRFPSNPCAAAQARAGIGITGAPMRLAITSNGALMVDSDQPAPVVDVEHQSEGAGQRQKAD